MLVIDVRIDDVLEIGGVRIKLVHKSGQLARLCIEGGQEVVRHRPNRIKNKTNEQKVLY